MPATTLGKVTLIAALLLVGCGGGGNSVVQPPPPPPPPPPPTFSNPQLAWTGDEQVSSGFGDHGVGSSGPSGAASVPDGSGGAIIVWEDRSFAAVHGQHLDATGKLLWQATGVSPSNVNTYQASPQAVSDGAGGTVVAWVDGRGGVCNEAFQFNCDIYAQRIDSSGNLLWSSSGAPIVTDPANQGSSGIAMISDGSGGAIMAWEDGRSPCCRVYAQRVASSGQVLWALDGIQVSPTPPIVIGTIGVPQMISDGNGGAIVAWWNTQSADPNQVRSVSAQRLGADGALMWAAGGVTVSGLTGGFGSGNMLGYDLTSDGDGGAIFSGSFIDQTASGVATVQRIDKTGSVQWPSSGVQLASAPSHVLNPKILTDGSGGAIVAWADCVSQGVNCSILAQRVDPSGRLLWAVNGISLTSTPNRKFGPIVLGDGAGGAVVAWEDCPNVSALSQCADGIDLYGQRINPNGQTMWQLSGFPISAAPDNQGVQTGNLDVGIYVSSDSLGNIFLVWPDGRINHSCTYTPVLLPSHCDLFAQKLH